MLKLTILVLEKSKYYYLLVYSTLLWSIKVRGTKGVCESNRGYLKRGNNKIVGR